jgi:xylulokinase
LSLLGVDIGTGSSKAVVTDADGTILAHATRGHRTSSPRLGWFEHDADDIWWADFCALLTELRQLVDLKHVQVVAVSGIGPVTLLADANGRPVRPAILYGIDTRAQQEIRELTQILGRAALLKHSCNLLTTQAVAPKLLWVARHEHETWARARRWYSASGYVVGRLTGEYVVDHYTASTSDPLYDLTATDWWAPAWDAVAPSIERPRLAWPGEVVGTVLPAIAHELDLAAGTPVLAGTIDALAESYSVGCREVGDLMVMYGSTLFLIQTVAKPAAHPGLWAAAGRTNETYSIAAGMATSGLITTWLADLLGADLGLLFEEAATVPAGSDALVLLPYFSGERTPLFDPEARGCWIGLTLGHGRGHLTRSTLEGVAYGVRHNIETMVEAGSAPRRLVAVGGGTRGNLWTQIVSDVTGLPQDLPSITIGAAYGDARMSADALGVNTNSWNLSAERIEPQPETAETYDALYGVYRRAYLALREDMHLLARRSADVGLEQ